MNTCLRPGKADGGCPENAGSVRKCSDETGRPSLQGLAGGVFFALLLAGARHSEASPRGISSVSVSRGFFNPSLEQRIEISLTVERAGSLSLFVLDGDGRVARRLAPAEPVKAGRVTRIWDGRNDAGQIVGDGVYTLKADLRGPEGRATYLPSRRRTKQGQVATTFYDRENGIIAYKLSTPSRVFLQARSLRVSRTIVDGEPRTAGSVIDHWNGFDESGKERIADLPGFMISITATPLPENAIITVGKRAPSAVASGRSRP